MKSKVNEEITYIVLLLIVSFRRKAEEILSYYKYYECFSDTADFLCVDWTTHLSSTQSLAFIHSHQAAPHITHESIWAEESRFSGSSGVGSGYVWSNTAVNTALFAGW